MVSRSFIAMRHALAALLAALAALSAAAADEERLRTGWHSFEIPVAKRKSAPTAFPLAPAAAAERAPVMNLKPGAACGASEFEVCVDSSGRITMPGARRFLPALPGLTPERLSVRRHGIVLGYSF